MLEELERRNYSQSVLSGETFTVSVQVT